MLIIKTFENNAKIGDSVVLGVGIRKTIYGNELSIIIKKVYPAQSEK